MTAAPIKIHEEVATMEETTSKLLCKLRSREDGMAMLRQSQPDVTCAQVLSDLLKEKGLTTTEWIAAANVSKSYAYQILRGERKPGRNILLRTALALRLSLKETQRLLARSCSGALYPQIRRDAAVIFALNQHMTLMDTEELLASLPKHGLYAGET